MTLLAARGVVEITGADRVAFLQGLVSNDVEQAATGRAVWTALLTPQGKWLADFFIFSHGDSLLLDCERSQMAMLVQRLGRYRLRAEAALREAPEWQVYAAWNGPPSVSKGIVAADPRLPQAGWRILSALDLTPNAVLSEWDAHRIALGLPDGSRDMEAEKSVLLEAGFDELGGVSWSKGCYMGQELTARTKYRGLVKRRLLPVAVTGEAVPGAAVTSGGQEVGVIRSVAGGRALALLRIDALDRQLDSSGVSVTPLPPSWMKLPEPAA